MVALVSMVALAGCVEDTGPPVSSRTVPTDAPSEGGGGDYTLRLQIVDEPGGPPIHDAAVIVYWGDFDGEASGSVDISGGAGPDGASGVVRAGGSVSTPDVDETIPLRTNTDGIATAHVPANRIVGIVASADGHTEEWIPRAGTGDPGTSGTVPFALYQANIETNLDGTWGPAGASPGRVTNSNFQWEALEAPWGESDAARAGYVERLANLRLTLTWTNGPTGGGDLSIGTGATQGEPDAIQESDGFQGGPGSQTEEVVYTAAEIDEMNWPDSDRLYVGPATSTAYAAPLGLDYQLTVEAAFDPFTDPNVDGFSNESPSLGLALLPLLALCALVLRRR